MKRATLASMLVICAAGIGALLLSSGTVAAQDDKDDKNDGVRPYNPYPPWYLAGRFGFRDSKGQARS
jgi:hypothetical protein